MHIPRWAKIVLLGVLIIAVVQDPSGTANIFKGWGDTAVGWLGQIGTFFKTLTS